MLRVFFILFVGLSATLLWNTGLLLPFKLLIVLIHEIWHGFVAMLGGAHLEHIHIDLKEGGETVVSQLHSDSFLLLTISAGYLGSALTGGLLIHRGLVAASGERVTLILLGACLGYMSYLFTSAGSLAFYVGLLWSLALFLGALGGQLAARCFLLLLGTLFVWYALYDLLDFTLDGQESDAAILAIHMIREDWWLAFSTEPAKLSMYISVVWSLLVLGIIAFFLFPILKTLQAAHLPIPEENSIVEPPAEVDEWLLSRGLRWDAGDAENGKGESVVPLEQEKTELRTGMPEPQP